MTTDIQDLTAKARALLPEFRLRVKRSERHYTEERETKAGVERMDYALRTTLLNCDVVAILTAFIAQAESAGRARDEALEEAALCGYLVCAKKQYLSLGDDVEKEILSLKQPPQEKVT